MPGVGTAPVLDPAKGAALNDEGYAILSGRGPGGRAALLPGGDHLLPVRVRSDQNYSFTLYNLGDALTQLGRGEEAIPYLELRLERWDDRDAIVQATLDEAEAQAQARRIRATLAPADEDDEGEDSEDDAPGNSEGKGKGHEKARARTRAAAARQARGSGGDARQHFLRDVEVGVDVVDVVLVVERVEQAQQASRLVLGDLDQVLGLHRDVGRLDLDSVGLERLADGA